MKFADIPTCNAHGWRLAHSLMAGSIRLAKGHLLTADDIAHLIAGGTHRITAFRLDAADIPEDDAAAALAASVCGPGLTADRAHKGRANIRATETGLLSVSTTVNDINATGEDLTIATLYDHSPVTAGQMVATVKVIPYAVHTGVLDQATALGAALSIHPYQPFSAVLISTDADMGPKPIRITEARLNAVGGTLIASHTCPHDPALLADTLQTLARGDTDLILIFGLSAISDRHDTVPAALVQAGGTILHLGMPVDPGNLLMLGKLGTKIVIGLPGCAKSPALNGLDFILRRFAARLPLDRATLQNMGIGGLLKEAPRGEPRAKSAAGAAPIFAAVILAAGRASRAQGQNKLLSCLGGTPVIRHTVQTLLQAMGDNIIVVTGHDAPAVGQALSGLPVSLVCNAQHATGMASSLKAGLAEIPAETPKGCSHVLVLLGDMPFVRVETCQTLMQAAADDQEAGILIPTFHGKRGNPVLWHQRMIPLLMGTQGDTGGRDIIRHHSALVREIAVDDPGILIDLDTPEALAQFGVTAKDR